MKTVISFRREDSWLRRGLSDVFTDSGPLESDFVARSGAGPLRWPMGGEAFWPFFRGEQFEAFFRLMDDPANFAAYLTANTIRYVVLLMEPGAPAAPELYGYLEANAAKQQFGKQLLYTQVRLVS